MKNWLGQEIEVGVVVYRGHRQGSHDDMVGVVSQDHGDGSFTVKWHFALVVRGVPCYKETRCNGFVLVRLDESVLTSLNNQQGE